MKCGFIYLGVIWVNRPFKTEYHQPGKRCLLDHHLLHLLCFYFPLFLPLGRLLDPICSPSPCLRCHLSQLQCVRQPEALCELLFTLWRLYLTFQGEMEQTGDNMLTAYVLFHHFMEHTVHSIHICVSVCVCLRVDVSAHTHA